MDSDGYTYDAELTLSVTDVELEIANAKPGEAHLDVLLEGELVITNTTPERNLPSHLRSVGLAYTPADYLAVGFEYDSPLTHHLTDPVEIESASLYPIDDNSTPIAAGESVRLDLRSLPGASLLSEHRARATLALLESGRPVTLTLFFDHGTEIQACTSVAVFVRQNMSTEYNEVCSAPHPENLRVLLDDAGTVAGDQPIELTFEATAGMVIDIDYSQRGAWSPCLVIETPSGDWLYGNCTTGSYEALTSAPESGAYRVTIEVGHSGSENYRLRVLSVAEL